MIGLDELVDMVEGYRQRVYNEDMQAIDRVGGMLAVVSLGLTTVVLNHIIKQISLYRYSRCLEQAEDFLR